MEIVPLKKICSTLGRKKHENMKTQKPTKIDAKTQKTCAENTMAGRIAEILTLHYTSKSGI